MKATIITSRKTKASAEREAAWYAQAEPMNQRVIKQDGIYYVVRDWHPSDEGRSFGTIEVTA
jgi:hypothetical protein